MEKDFHFSTRLIPALFLLWIVVAQHYLWIAVMAFLVFLGYLLISSRRRIPPLALPRFGSILFLGLVLRLIALFVFGTEQFNDFWVYERMANNVRNGEYILCLEKQSGPSILYALASIPFNSVLNGGIALNLSLQLLDIYLAYRIGRALRSEKTGRIVALFVACFPDHIYYTRLLSSEVFATTLMLLAVYLLVRSRWKTALFIPLGLVLGALNYFRPEALLLTIATMAVILLSDRTVGEKIRSAFVILAFFLINIPLIHYNYSQMSVFSITSSQTSGMTMLFATTNKDDGIFQGDQYNLFMDLQTNEESGHPLHVANRRARNIALERIADKPLEWLAYAFTNRLPMQFGGSSIRWSWAEATGIVAKFHLISALICSLILLSYAWLLAVRRSFRNDLSRLVLLFLLLTVALHLFAEVNPRYNHSLILLMGVFVGVESEYSKRHGARA